MAAGPKIRPQHPSRFSIGEAAFSICRVLSSQHGWQDFKPKVARPRGHEGKSRPHLQLLHVTRALLRQILSPNGEAKPDSDARGFMTSRGILKMRSTGIITGEAEEPTQASTSKQKKPPAQKCWELKISRSTILFYWNSCEIPKVKKMFDAKLMISSCGLNLRISVSPCFTNSRCLGSLIASLRSILIAS